MSETQDPGPVDNKQGLPELGVPQFLPRNFKESGIEHRYIVNQEGQPLILWNGWLYWAGSGRIIGPASILKPTCPKEYYFCDYCAGTFTMADSTNEDEMSLAKHYSQKHRDIVVQKMKQPQGLKGGFWTPSDEAVHEAARKMAGEHPAVQEKDPMPVIASVPNLGEANKKQAKTVKLVTEPSAGK